MNNPGVCCNGLLPYWLMIDVKQTQKPDVCNLINHCNNDVPKF